MRSGSGIPRIFIATIRILPILTPTTGRYWIWKSNLPILQMWKADGRGGGGSRSNSRPGSVESGKRSGQLRRIPPGAHVEDGVEGMAWRETEQVTTFVSLSLQGELGLPGPVGVPGLIVSTQMPGDGEGQDAGCGEQATSPLRGAGTDKSRKGAQGRQACCVASDGSPAFSQPLSSVVK